MAPKPDGKAAKTERVTFTRPAAERIAKVVRRVEQGDRGTEPLTFDRVAGGGNPIVLRVATFTANWAVGDTTTLTFYNVTTTPNTVVAHNLHLSVKPSPTTTECLIAKAGTAWYLATVNLKKAQGFSQNDVQVLGHDDDGFVKWYSVSTCSTAQG